MKHKKTDIKNIFLHLIISFSLPLSIFFIIINLPSGYNLNIYSTYPILFWIFLIFIYLLILMFGFSNRRKKYFFSIFLIILYLSLFLISSNYVLSNRNDDFSHMGEILHIEKKGLISENNIYPVTHILLSNLKMVARLDITQLSNIIYPIYSLTYMLFCLIIFLFYLRKEEVKSSSKYISFIIPFFFIFFLGEYHFNIRPHLISFLFLGISLYSLLNYLQNKEKPYFIIFLISAIIIPLSHPLFGFTFIGTICAIFLVKYITTNREIFSIKSFWILLIISILPTITWFFYNLAIYQKLSFLITRMISNDAPSVALRTVDLLSIGNFTFFELLSRGILLYLGRYIFLVIIIFCYIFLKYKHGKKHNIKFFSGSVIKELFLILLLLSILQLFLIIGPISGHNPQRLININILIYFLIPLIAIISLKILSYTKKTIGIVIFVLILCQITSTMIIFPSPMVYQPDNSLMINEVQGLNWFDEHKSNLRIDDFQGQLVERYYDFKNGFTESEEKITLMKNEKIIEGITNSSNMNRLFYDNFMHFPINDFYLVLTSAGVEPYLSIDKWQETGRLYESDIEHLNNDIEVNKIYQSMNINFFKT